MSCYDANWTLIRWYQFCDYAITVWQPPIDDFWQVILKILNKAIVWFWLCLHESGHFWNHILYSCTFFTWIDLSSKRKQWIRSPKPHSRVISDPVYTNPGSKISGFKNVKGFISNDIFNCHYNTYVTRASIIVWFFLHDSVWALEGLNVINDPKCKNILS